MPVTTLPDHVNDASDLAPDNILAKLEIFVSNDNVPADKDVPPCDIKAPVRCNWLGVGGFVVLTLIVTMDMIKP